MFFDFKANRHLMEAGKKIYFIGIGGISMSGLAELAHARGQKVAGSDLNYNSRCDDLAELGILIYTPQQASNIDCFQPDAVVYSAAVPADNPERVRAVERGIISIERSDWLGLLNREFNTVINVAGTNGKSTVTAMTSLICLDAGLNPTVHIGAELAQFKSTIHVGGRELMISEACEFNYSFWSFYSTIASVLNLGHDHVDMFPEMKDVISAFTGFLNRLPENAKVVLPTFDPYMDDLLNQFKQNNPALYSSVEFYTFGYPGDLLLGRPADLQASELEFIHGFPRFTLLWRGEQVASVQLSIPGKFNVENALSAILMAHLAGASFESAASTLRDFTGAEGRFTYCGDFNGAHIFNDYAHHPDSVKLTLEAAHKIPHKNLYACFQPITYSRAKGLFDGFVEALQNEKHAILVEVYDDREKDRSFSSSHISDAINEKGGSARFYSTPDELEEYLRKAVHEGDMVLLMGQNIRNVGDRLAGRTSHYTSKHSLWEILEPEKQ